MTTGLGKKVPKKVAWHNFTISPQGGSEVEYASCSGEDLPGLTPCSYQPPVSPDSKPS